jgi:hypothetical protein
MKEENKHHVRLYVLEILSENIYFSKIKLIHTKDKKKNYR